MTRVLILDQLNDYGISPYSLHVESVPFEELIRDVEVAELADVPDSFTPRWGTMLIRAHPTTGRAEVWKYNLDSSG